MADWTKIRNEYINGNISQRKLAEKHGISYHTLRSRAEKEQWSDKREEQQRKITEKTAQKTAELLAEREAERLLRISNAADKLLEKIEAATEQLDQFVITNRVKQKEIKYATNRDGRGKPSKEIIKEIEDKRIVRMEHLDRMGLKQLASALKDLQGIQSTQKEDGLQETPTINITVSAATLDDMEVDED